MAVYFITGKLGAGKTLCAVGRIRDYLVKGSPVATNLDLDLVNMVGAFAKSPRVLRVPDKPTLPDLEAIGRGNDTYDESKNGLLVLDECGTWFNSRSWNDKTRQPVINWMLHARKFGWDILFIIQDISIVDKQAREALAEHVAYCKRLDRIAVPFLGFVWKLITGKKLSLPKIHMAIVKYGDRDSSLVVDRWFYFGRSLYSSYDTKQAFSDFYDKGVFSQLPPWLSAGRYMVPRDWRFYMRMTKIYFKRYSKTAVLSLGIALGVMFGMGSVIGGGFMYAQPEPVQASEPARSEAPEPAQTEPAQPALSPKAMFQSMVGKVSASPEPDHTIAKVDADPIAGCVNTSAYCRCYTQSGKKLDLTPKQCENRASQLFDRMITY